SAIRDGRLQPQTPAVVSLAGQWTSILTLPLRDERGATRATLALVELPEVFGAEAMLPPNSVATILDRNGTIIARSNQPRTWTGRNMRDTPFASLALRQAEGRTEALGVDGVARQYGFTSLPDIGWHIYVGIPTESAMEPVKPFLIRSAVGGLAIIVLVA